MNWIALAALVIGVATAIWSLNNMGQGAAGVDRLPLTIIGIVGGCLLAIAAVIYLIVQAFF